MGPTLPSVEQKILPPHPMPIAHHVATISDADRVPEHGAVHPGALSSMKPIETHCQSLSNVCGVHRQTQSTRRIDSVTQHGCVYAGVTDPASHPPSLHCHMFP